MSPCRRRRCFERAQRNQTESRPGAMTLRAPPRWRTMRLRDLSIDGADRDHAFVAGRIVDRLQRAITRCGDDDDAFRDRTLDGGFLDVGRARRAQREVDDPRAAELALLVDDPVQPERDRFVRAVAVPVQDLDGPELRVRRDADSRADLVVGPRRSSRRRACRGRRGCRRRRGRTRVCVSTGRRWRASRRDACRRCRCRGSRR